MFEDETCRYANIRKQNSKALWKLQRKGENWAFSEANFMSKLTIKGTGRLSSSLRSRRFLHT